MRVFARWRREISGEARLTVKMRAISLPRRECYTLDTMSWIDQHEDMAGAFAAAAAGKSVDAQQFREAMSRLGAAVHVVTTDGPAGKTGFTATAVVSVSDDPATLLVCLNRTATSMPILRENGVFCVNT